MMHFTSLFPFDILISSSFFLLNSDPISKLGKNKLVLFFFVFFVGTCKPTLGALCPVYLFLKIETDSLLENKSRLLSRKTRLSCKDPGSVSEVFPLRPTAMALSLWEVFSQSYCCFACLLDWIFKWCMLATKKNI